MACHLGLWRLVRDQAESAPHILFCGPSTQDHFPENLVLYLGLLAGTSLGSLSLTQWPCGDGEENEHL